MYSHQNFLAAETLHTSAAEDSLIDSTHLLRSPCPSRGLISPRHACTLLTVSYYTIIVNICDNYLRAHIASILRRLHWLPVQQRVEFKVALLIHKSLLCQMPSYLADGCQLIADSSRRTLRSSDTATFVVPRTNSTFGDRSFAVAAARIWNSLPTSLRSVDLSTERFKRALKTFLFVWDRGASVTLFKARRI